MKNKMLTLITALVVSASPHVLADDFNDGGLVDSTTNSNGDSNALVQGFDQDPNNNLSMSENNLSDANISRDGETIGEEE